MLTIARSTYHRHRIMPSSVSVLCSWRGGVDECERAAPECHPDAGAVAWLSTQRWQIHRSWCASFSIKCRRRQLSTRPRRRHWQLVDTGRATLRHSVAQRTIICDRLDRHYNHCRWMLHKHCSRRFFPVAWATATRFCTASPTTLSNVCSQFRPLPQGWLHGQFSVNTSQTFLCGNYIGYRFNAVSSSSWLHWCTRHFTTLHRRICQMSVSCCRTPIVVPAHGSSTALSCVVPRTKTGLGDRSLDVAGLRIWNKLPDSMLLIEDFGYFRKLLKAHLFAALNDFCFQALVTNSFTYLLI